MEFDTLHFGLVELTRTGTGLPNVPGDAEKANLTRLAVTLLEPIRTLLAAPLIGHSAYRCQAVNAAVGGATNSAHMDGRAYDFHPGNGMDIKQEFDRIRISELLYDKILMEHHGASWWIHVQIAKAGAQPRRKAYTARVTDHGTIYTEVPNGSPLAHPDNAGGAE